MDITNVEVLLREKLSQEQLEDTLQEKIRQFQGLLTREVALKIIAKEQGLLKEEERFFMLNEVPKQAKRVSAIASIARINPMKTYPSRNKSRTIVLKDDSGTMPLTLWNDDIELLKRLKIGDRIEIKDAYEKNGELLLSYKGTISLVEEAAFIPLDQVAGYDDVVVRAKIEKIEGEKKYSRDGKENAFFSFWISDGNASARCIIWDSIGRAKSFEVDDEIILENAKVKNGELHVNARSRMLVKKAKGLHGILKSMECEDEKLKLEIDGKPITLDRSEALKLLGTDVAPDISLATIVMLKKQSLLNKYIVIPNR